MACDVSPVAMFIPKAPFLGQFFFTNFGGTAHCGINFGTREYPPERDAAKTFLTPSLIDTISGFQHRKMHLTVLAGDISDARDLSVEPAL